jgi:hypothetical protein
MPDQKHEGVLVHRKYTGKCGSIITPAKAWMKTRNSLARSTRLLVARLELDSFEFLINEPARLINEPARASSRAKTSQGNSHDSNCSQPIYPSA